MAIGNLASDTVDPQAEQSKERLRAVDGVRACRGRIEEHDARDPGPLDGLRNFGRVGLGLGVEGRRRRRVDDRAVASEAVQQGR